MEHAIAVRENSNFGHLKKLKSFCKVETFFTKSYENVHELMKSEKFLEFFVRGADFDGSRTSKKSEKLYIFTVFFVTIVREEKTKKSKVFCYPQK